MTIIQSIRPWITIRILKITMHFVKTSSVLLEDVRNRKHFDPWKTSLFGENVFMWWMWHNNVGHWVVNEYENFFLKFERLIYIF